MNETPKITHPHVNKCCVCVFFCIYESVPFLGKLRSNCCFSFRCIMETKENVCFQSFLLQIAKYLCFFSNMYKLSKIK